MRSGSRGMSNLISDQFCGASMVAVLEQVRRLFGMSTVALVDPAQEGVPLVSLGPLPSSRLEVSSERGDSSEPARSSELPKRFERPNLFERPSLSERPGQSGQPSLVVDATHGLQLVAYGPEVFAEDRRLLGMPASMASQAWQGPQIDANPAQARPAPDDGALLAAGFTPLRPALGTGGRTQFADAATD